MTIVTLVATDNPTLCVTCSLQPDRRTVYWNSQPIRLSPKQFKVFAILFAFSPQAVTRAMIYEDSLGLMYDRDSRIIDVYLTQIRKRIMRVQPGTERFVMNIRGRGFALSGATPKKYPAWTPAYAETLLQQLAANLITLEEVLAMHPDMSMEELRFWNEQYRTLGIAGLKANGYSYHMQKRKRLNTKGKW